MQDAALYYSITSKKHSTVIKDLSLGNKKFILSTIHRQENTDNIENLHSIIEGLNKLSRDFEIVFPMHPRTKVIIEKHNIKLNFTPIDPVGYFDMIELLKHCRIVVTDSGGLQKKLFSLADIV